MSKILQLYLKTAKKLKLPHTHRKEFNGIEIYLSGKKYSFRGGSTPFNDGASENISINKCAVNQLLHNANFPVPHLAIISKNNCINGIWSLPKITYPVVAKPTVSPSGNGRDVLCNIQEEQTLISYLNKNKEKYDFFNIEMFEQGLIDYRVLVFFNKVIAVAQRDPASVMGDGKHTVSELIEIENEKRSKVTTVTLEKIKIDEECEIKLKELDLTLEKIPQLNKKITLCYTCNDARGGTEISLGDSICPENAALACQAAKILNLNLVGFDIICEDIQRPISQSRGFILEANITPDPIMHETPLAGIPIPISKIFLKKIMRKHFIAYTIHYLKQSFYPYGFYLRASSVLIFIFGFIRLLNKI